MEIALTNAALALYCASCVAGILYLMLGRDAISRSSALLATGGFAFLSMDILCRWIEAGHAPVTSMYETLILFAWATWLVALILIVPIGMKAMLALTPLIAVVCLGYASTLDSSIKPLFPALRSNWLVIHVAANFLGYAGFGAGFIAGIGLAVALMRNQPHERWERSSVTCIRFGFIFLTYGILTGSVWANEAWTSYWGWDPKEIWALLTWIFYFIMLLVKSSVTGAARRPRLTAFFAVGGFFFVLFTYLGVSYLLRGLHSYFSA